MKFTYSDVWEILTSIPDVKEIVVAIIGFATVVVSKCHNFKSTIKKILLVFGVFLIIASAGLCTWKKFFIAYIAIKFPYKNMEVSSTEDISGECRNIQSNGKIWIVVYSHSDNTYYPHRAAADIENDRNWNSYGVSIGSSADYGKMFDVIPLLVDANALTLFQNYFNNPASRGWTALPAGVQQFNKVEVKRR